jgi:phosphoribosylformylglycinamidine synthase
LQALEANGQIVLRYVENPNGSIANIAGIANLAGNVVGLMPHPERAMSTLLGSADGRVLLQGFLDAASRVGASS